MCLARVARIAVLVPSVLLAQSLVASAPSAFQRERLSAPLTTGGDVSGFLISSDSLYAVYHADQDQDEVREIYAVALAAPRASWKLNDELVPGGSVTVFVRISADAQRVVYLADQLSNDRFELFSVPLAGGTPTRLNGTLAAAGADVWDDFSISPDSQRVVYRADQDALDVEELFSAPIGGGPAVQLNGTLPAGGDVNFLRISPDSTRVVYHADQDVNNRAELYSAPIDGSAAAVKLNGPLVAGGGVFGSQGTLAISPDSSRVVYTAAQDDVEASELYSVPLDGSAAPVKISGTLVTGGDARNPKVSPDSTRVVFTADKNVDETDELYSVPLDGSTAPVQLNGTLVAGGDVNRSLHLISPDSSRVVYTADQDVDGVPELYSVPIDASAAPVKLHLPLAPGQGVDAAPVAISADSTRVVFLASLDAASATQVYSAPLDGSSPPVVLSGALVSGGDAVDFVLAPDGLVAYRADQEVDERYELFAAPIDGSRPPRRVNGPLPPFSTAVGQYGPAAGGRILYTAIWDESNVVELFMTTLARVRQSGF